MNKEELIKNLGTIAHSGSKVLGKKSFMKKKFLFSKFQGIFRKIICWKKFFKNRNYRSIWSLFLLCVNGRVMISMRSVKRKEFSEELKLSYFWKKNAMNSQKKIIIFIHFISLVWKCCCEYSNCQLVDVASLYFVMPI